MSARHYRHPALDPRIRWTWRGEGEIVYYARAKPRGVKAHALCATRSARLRQVKRGPPAKYPGRSVG